PRLAADALNALARNFISLNLERRYDASSYAKTFLQEQLEQTKAKLEDSERALVDFQRSQQIINIDDKQNVLAQTLTAYNTAVAQATEARLKAEALYNEFKQSPESSPQMIDSKSMGTLREQRTKLQVEYQDQLRIYKPSFPKMLQLKASIDVLDLQNRSIRYNVLKREVETNRSLYDGLLQRLKEVGVEGGVGTNNVTVVDSALVPDGPFKPNLTLNMQL